MFYLSITKDLDFDNTSLSQSGLLKLSKYITGTLFLPVPTDLYLFGRSLLVLSGTWLTPKVWVKKKEKPSFY